ncbi:hypothetical protein OG455_37070 [Kitasatospora sp. NBC_01287]|uniref:hypothetical protein n=1 Tax=Kitasatospora sp. NBC_01287 TaxID=2903573 RepID=UPI00224E1C14|nr:hypothetical protein [Kitasatospora sp. NBC_01287]MCX4751052.1 hypothetical protein [Kitasatospora sp. NBC_01287]
MTASIEALFPRDGRDDLVALRAVDADELARYVADPANPWWQRRPCATALAGRVPEQRVPELLARVRDPQEVGEVRKALLDALAEQAGTGLLPWLQHEDQRHSRSIGMPEAFLKARGVLGDRTATAELATLANDPWRHQHVVGAAGLDALIARYGLAALLADLGDLQRPEDRVLRTRVRHLTGEDVTDMLADPDRAVAHHAQSLLSDADRLREYLGGAPTTEAKLWAAYALHRLTGDTARTRAIYDTLGRPRVEVAGVDEELRKAIVHQYGHRCQRQSDPRWRIEALCTEQPEPTDQDEQLRRATTALLAADQAPQPPLSCGQYHQQGDGTYHIIRFGGARPLLVSTLGRFVTAQDADPAIRRALESAGFRWIDATTGAIQVTGLCVYHFGAREALDVRTLLFYWQD